MEKRKVFTLIISEMTKGVPKVIIYPEGNLNAGVISDGNDIEKDELRNLLAGIFGEEDPILSDVARLTENHSLLKQATLTAEEAMRLGWKPTV